MVIQSRKIPFFSTKIGDGSGFENYFYLKHTFTLSHGHTRKSPIICKWSEQIIYFNESSMTWDASFGCLWMRRRARVEKHRQISANISIRSSCWGKRFALRVLWKDTVGHRPLRLWPIVHCDPAMQSAGRMCFESSLILGDLAKLQGSIWKITAKSRKDFSLVIISLPFLESNLFKQTILMRKNHELIATLHSERCIFQAEVIKTIQDLRIHCLLLKVHACNKNVKLIWAYLKSFSPDVLVRVLRRAFPVRRIIINHHPQGG